MTQMNEVIKVNQDDFDVTVQPGVTRKFINNHLKDYGLWFPVGKFQVLTMTDLIQQIILCNPNNIC